jgi:hypothetical protein
VSKSTTLSKEQIAELKLQHSCKHIFKVSGSDGKTVYLKDPFSVFAIAKLLLTAMGKSLQEFAESFLKNCAIAGDLEVVEDPAWATGVIDEIKELIDMPEAEVKKRGTNGYSLSCDGITINCRGIERQDLVTASRLDKTKEPFEESIKLLGLITSDKDYLQYQETNCRGFIGILTALDQLKAKVTISVEKL